MVFTLHGSLVALSTKGLLALFPVRRGIGTIEFIGDLRKQTETLQEPLFGTFLTVINSHFTFSVQQSCGFIVTGSQVNYSSRKIYPG